MNTPLTMHTLRAPARKPSTGATANDTAQHTLHVLLAIEQRLTRMESRFVRLLIHVGLDQNGWPIRSNNEE